MAKEKNKGKIKITREFMIHMKEKLKEIREKGEAKAVKDIRYNVILTVFNLWLGQKKHEEIAINMTNEVYCLIHYFHTNKKGGAMVKYQKGSGDEEEEFKWGWWGALAQACICVYLLFSTTTRTYTLVQVNTDSLHKIKDILGPELREDVGKSIINLFDDKLEDAQLISSDINVQQFIQESHHELTDQFYLDAESTTNPHAIALPSFQGINLLENMLPTVKDFETSPLPRFCETTTSCLFDLTRLGIISVIKSAGGGEYIGSNLLDEIDHHNQELKAMTTNISNKMSKRMGWSIDEFRQEYPALDELIIKLEQPTKNHLKEALTSIVYGYQTGWWQLSQIMGIIEDIPFDAAGRIQGVLNKKRNKIQILMGKIMTNSIEILGNAKYILVQSLLLMTCIFYLKPKKKPRDTHLLYLEDAQKKKKRKRKKTKRKKKRSKKKSKKSKKNLRRK